MRITKWGNSLAVKLPVSLVRTLNLKEGDEIEFSIVSKRDLPDVKQPSAKELLQRLRTLRGYLPHDFRFERTP